MKKKISKTQVQEQIKEFFSEIKSKNPKQIEKIKKMARSYRICMKNYKKLFCKKCFRPYDNPKIRIKNKIKSVECKNCNYIARYKL